MIKTDPEFEAVDPNGKRIVMAEQNEVDKYQRGIDLLIYNLAPFCSNNNMEERIKWMNSVFVSDESSIYDFLSPEKTEELFKAININGLKDNMLIWQIGKAIQEDPRFISNRGCSSAVDD